MSHPPSADTAVPDVRNAGYLFIGKLIDKCSEMEQRLTDMLRTEVHAGRLKKVPMLAGQKLEAVRRLTTTRANSFHDPERAASILQEYEAFSSLRAELCHSRHTVACCIEKPEKLLYLYEGPSCGAANNRKAQLVYEEKDLKRLHREVSDIVNRFRQAC